jgi:AraC-like DNA-binding protein
MDNDDPDGGIRTLNFATDPAAPADNFAAWRRTLGTVFDVEVSRATRAENFAATLTAYHFGLFLLCHSYIDSGRYRRADEKILQDDLDHYIVHLLIRGRVSFIRAQRGVGLRPRDIGILDLSRRAELRIYHEEAISLIFPRTALSLPLKNPDHRHGQVLSRTTPVASLLARQMETLDVEAPRLDTRQATALAAAVIELVATCISLGQEPDPDPPVVPKPDPNRQVRAYIEKNLHRETLTPTDIMKDLAISRSRLYRQFERFGGVQRYIRRRRLRRCFIILCNPRHADQRIAEIAYSMGFTDEAHFSRLFRHAFGMSPRAARTSTGWTDADHPAGAMPPPAAAPVPFAQWIEELIAG